MRISIAKVKSETEFDTRFDIIITDPQVLENRDGSNIQIHYAKKVLIENIYRDALACVSNIGDI